MLVIDADGHAMETFEDRYYEEPARSWPGRPRILKMSPGDHVVGGHREHPLLKKKPGEYMRSEQCYYSCEVEDLTLPAAVDILGEDRILWASDYPHHDAEKDAVQILKAREDIPESAKRKMLSENAARFYKIKY